MVSGLSGSLKEEEDEEEVSAQSATDYIENVNTVTPRKLETNGTRLESLHIDALLGMSANINCELC